MMTNGDHEGQIFYLTLTRIMDYFSCSPLNTSFHFENKTRQHEIDFKKILNTLRCDMVMSFKHSNDVPDRHAARVRLFVFYLFLGLVQVCEITISCEIEISHIGKNNG